MAAVFCAGATGATAATAPAANAAHTMPSADPVVLPASAPEFVYEGRIDRAKPAEPVVIWEASRIRLGFDGDSLVLRFANLKGQVFFDARVDGLTTLVELRENAPRERVTLDGFGPGRHELLLFKRSEATAGTVGFAGVELAAGAHASRGTVPPYATTMLFLGDSITVGACNEDGAEDQWEDRRTHNAALSWAALTAQAFSADHRNISVSGMGVATGWFPELVGDIWNRLYPTATSTKADLTTWTPHVIFINYGENDDSFTRAHQQPFPAAFTNKYIEFVHAVRAAFPSAEIVILRGGMTGGATSVPLREAWESVVQRLETSDPRVHQYVFHHWSTTHPRVPDDRAMADELVAWLREQQFMAKVAKTAPKRE
jgi:lysophospholipase L1-like esterase